MVSKVVDFDLFILKSWDGNRTDFGPDVFQLSVRGGPTLIRVITVSGVNVGESIP